MQYGNAAKLFSSFYRRVFTFLILLFIVDLLFVVVQNQGAQTILSIVAFILTPLATLSLIDQARATSQHEVRPFFQSLKRWFRVMPILKFYGILILFLIPALILISISIGFATAKMALAAIIVSFVLFVYFVYAIPRLVFTFCTFVIEETGAIESIKKAFKLIKGNYWYTFFSITLFYLFFLILAAVISGIINAALLASHGSTTPDTIKALDPTIRLISGLIASLLSAFFLVPYFQALSVKLYERAKSRATTSKPE